MGGGEIRIESWAGGIQEKEEQHHGRVSHANIQEPSVCTIARICPWGESFQAKEGDGEDGTGW